MPSLSDPALEFRWRAAFKLDAITELERLISAFAWIDALCGPHDVRDCLGLPGAAPATRCARAGDADEALANKL